jgi:ABC-type spermidine/putrescine transport system permease subunit II
MFRRFRVIAGFDRLRPCSLARLQSHLICAIVTLTVWAHAAAVFAQRRGQPPAETPAEKSYILPYVIVVLCIALGLLVVCRSGGRSNEPKIDDLEK